MASNELLFPRGLGGLSIVLNVGVALAWVASLRAVLAGASAVPEYQADPTLFWLIRTMDLAFVIPAALVTAVGLLRHAPWATRLAYAFTGLQVLLVAAVASMATVMALRHDPATNPPLLAVTAIMTAALGTVYGRLLYHAAKPSAGLY